MDNLGDIRLFVEAAQQGSLSAAGRKMGLTPAAASARLAKLEAGLKARLFERTTRQLRLTDEGRLYLNCCRQALQSLDDAEAALQAGQGVVRGKVRISATSDFGRNLLMHWLDEFNALYPEVTFALTLSDSLSNLVQEDIDLAIRFGVPQDSSLVARKLAPNRRVLCASPDYIARKGEPKNPPIWRISTASCSAPHPARSTNGGSHVATRCSTTPCRSRPPGKPTTARVAREWALARLRDRASNRCGTWKPTLRGRLPENPAARMALSGRAAARAVPLATASWRRACACCWIS